jgi:hypothetical protein
MSRVLLLLRKPIITAINMSRVLLLLWKPIITAVNMSSVLLLWWKPVITTVIAICHVYYSSGGGQYLLLAKCQVFCSSGGSRWLLLALCHVESLAVYVRQIRVHTYICTHNSPVGSLWKFRSQSCVNAQKQLSGHEIFHRNQGVWSHWSASSRLVRKRYPQLKQNSVLLLTEVYIQQVFN